MSAAVKSGQLRKIRVIEGTFGDDWRTQYPGMAIDAVYNLAIHDDRKSIYCKIDKRRKEKLVEMLKFYDITIGDFIGRMIDEHFETFATRQGQLVNELAEDFSGY